MYDALVLTLGFEPGPLVRALASTPLKRGGLVIVLTPEFKDERSERAFLDFKRIATMMFKGEELEVEFDRHYIPLKPLSKGVQVIRSIFNRIKDRDVSISLTGSMRALIIATFLAYLTTPWVKEPKVCVYLEGRGEYVEIPQVRRIIELAVTDVKQEILNALIDKPKTISELSLELSRDRSVIYRHISWLESRGLISRKGKYIEITELGKMLALPKE